MNTDNEAARRTTNPRQPWRDELARLRWLEIQMTRLSAALEHSARGLRETVTGAADTARRDELDARAAEMDGAAEAIADLITQSHPAAASDRDWGAWHLEELTRTGRLDVLDQLIAERTAALTPMTSVLDEAGSPE